MKKRIYCLLVLFLISVILAGCGNSVKNENELMDDFLAHAENYMVEGSSITEFSIIKRITEEENKKDTVYVQLTVDHPTATAYQAYIMYYTLYNDGWLLDSVESYQGHDATFKTVPKNDPTNEEIIEQLTAYSAAAIDEYNQTWQTNDPYFFEEGKYAVRICDGDRPSDQTYECIVMAERTYNYLVLEETQKLSFVFDLLRYEWALYNVEIIDESGSWYIDGYWREPSSGATILLEHNYGEHANGKQTDRYEGSCIPSANNTDFNLSLYLPSSLGGSGGGLSDKIGGSFEYISCTISVYPNELLADRIALVPIQLNKTVPALESVGIIDTHIEDEGNECSDNSVESKFDSSTASTESAPQLVYLLTQQRLTTYTDGTGSMLIIKNDYDENNRKSSSSQSYNGEEMIQTTFENYDQYGNCTLYVTTTAAGEQLIYDIVYTYDEKGNITEMVQTATTVAGEIYETAVMNRSYDENGNLITEIYVRDNAMYDLSDYEYRKEYTYGSNDYITRCITYNGEGSIDNIETYFCDTNGNIVLSVSDSSAINHRTYDAAGNIVSSDICRAGQLFSSATYSYNVVEADLAAPLSPNVATSDYTNESNEITTLLGNYFTAIQTEDEHAFASFLSEETKSIIAEENFEAIGYFEAIDFIYERCADDLTVEWDIENISFNDSNTVFTELGSEFYELASDLNIEVDLSASAVVSVKTSTDNLECIVFLYQYDGEWYYLFSLPLQIN